MSARWRYWLALFLVAAFSAVFSAGLRAETIAATSVPAPVENTYFAVPATPAGYQGATAIAACQASLAGNATWTFTGLGGTWGKDCRVVNAGGTNTTWGYVDQYFRCQGTSVWTTSVPTCTGTVNACPAGQGWTLSGNQCTRPDCGQGETRNAQGICEVSCQAGQTKLNGVCTCDSGAAIGTGGACCPTPGNGGGSAMQWCSVDGPSATTCDSAGANNCKVTCKSVAYQKGTGDQVSVYPKLALGQNCGYTGGLAPAGTGGGDLTGDQLKEVAATTKDPEKAKTPEGCLNSGSGYITSGGVTTCVSGGEGGEVVKTSNTTDSATVKNPTTGAQETTTTETKTAETTSSEGLKGTTTTATKTNPDGSKEITTTTRTQNPDGTVTTTTKVENVTAGGVSSVGSEKTTKSDTGTYCDKNPSDAICAASKDVCTVHPERIGCGELGAAPTADAIPDESRGVNLVSPVNLAQSNTCPTGVTLPKGLGAYDWRPMCDAAAAWKPVILAIAWLSAFFIVLGYSQKSDD